MRLGILVSGDLGFILLRHLARMNDIRFVMTDMKSHTILELCEENGWQTFIGNPRGGRSNSFLKGQDIEVLISANYLYLIEKDLIELPTKVAFNIHGSLLPKYRGRTPHVWAVINNEQETGISAHLIEEDCDSGPIIEQIRVPIEKDDTGGKILEKFQKLYIPLVESVLMKLSNKDLQFFPQDHSNATFFGKRTAADGLINWNWQKERIRNWVRAQSHPYPGAFSYYRGEKFIIDEIEYTRDGFNYKMTNGEILCSMPLKIKTPNGVIQVNKNRNKNMIFRKGDVLK